MIVIFFLLNNVVLLFKLFLLVFVKLFFVPNFLLKYILLLFCLTIIYSLYKYPRTRFLKLSQIRNYKLNQLIKYSLKTNMEHIYNIFVISLFTMVFTIMLFLLRYSNKNKHIDLKEKYHLIKNLYHITPFYDFLLNSFILFLIFIIYIWLFLRLIKYFKYHIIKRHLYLVGDLNNGNVWYEQKLFSHILSNITIHHIYSVLIRKMHTNYQKFYQYYKKKPSDSSFFFKLYKENHILFHFVTKWHYIILFFLVMYDLIFNNYQITHVFYVLPWTFFFEIYLRASTFVEGLWTPHDQYLHTILYAKQLEIWDEKTLIIDGDFYDYNNAKLIYKTYVARGFVKDPNHL